jgi:hypothetical protein
MSKIVAFRDNIVRTLQEKITDLEEVDWYDGIFDEQDISDWALKTPCAYVATVTSPTTPHTTGELCADLRCVVVVVHSDGANPRDADQVVWSICEGIADLANLNRFGDLNVGPSSAVKINRINHPQLRREGVAIGIVEWKSNITFGRNRSVEREFVYNNGVRVTQVPQSLTGRGQPYDALGRATREDLDLPPGNDGFTGTSTKNRGVAERPMTPGQIWEP